jgi:hypothetical protein
MRASDLRKEGAMATAAMSLTGWNIEYYQTMKTTERARLNVARTQAHAVPRHIRFLGEAFLYFPFRAVTHDTAKLVSILEKFEGYPASVLLEEDVEKMPQELQELFKKMCRVLQLTEEVGLSDGLILKASVAKLGELSQQIKGFADRFADAQIKQRSRVPAEEVQAYQESFAAYGNCEPSPEQFSEEDRKASLLRF